VTIVPPPIPNKPLAKPAHAPIRDNDNALTGFSLIASRESFFIFFESSLFFFDANAYAFMGTNGAANNKKYARILFKFTLLTLVVAVAPRGANNIAAEPTTAAAAKSIESPFQKFIELTEAVDKTAISDVPVITL
tara:strand:- start:20784 stop:21188 length:405 start_codon:yes stop_codon:yes gene_type:complete